jgi:hypothetical protein
MIALRDPLRDTIIAQSFAEGVAAGTVLWMLVSFVDFEQKMLRRSVLVPLGAAVALAVALLVAGSGPGSSGAKVNRLAAGREASVDASQRGGIASGSSSTFSITFKSSAEVASFLSASSHPKNPRDAFAPGRESLLRRIWA